MASALEDYLKRTGSSKTGYLGLDVPVYDVPTSVPAPSPAPPVNIPKFTKIGDRLAARGGFGDQPGELKPSANSQP